MVTIKCDENGNGVTGYEEIGNIEGLRASNTINYPVQSRVTVDSKSVTNALIKLIKEWIQKTAK